MTPDELRAARNAMSLSQSQLAQALGIHPMMVSKWERGISKPAPYLRLALERLAQNAQQPPKRTPKEPRA